MSRQLGECEFPKDVPLLEELGTEQAKSVFIINAIEFKRAPSRIKTGADAIVGSIYPNSHHAWRVRTYTGFVKGNMGNQNTLAHKTFPFQMILYKYCKDTLIYIFIRHVEVQKQDTA